MEGDGSHSPFPENGFCNVLPFNYFRRRCPRITLRCRSTIALVFSTLRDPVNIDFYPCLEAPYLTPPLYLICRICARICQICIRPAALEKNEKERKKGQSRESAFGLPHLRGQEKNSSQETADDCMSRLQRTQLLHHCSHSILKDPLAPGTVLDPRKRKEGPVNSQSPLPLPACLQQAVQLSEVR